MDEVLTKEEREENLLSLYRAACGFLDDLKREFPGKVIKLVIDKDGEDYWFEGDCYSEERRFYLPNN